MKKQIRFLLATLMAIAFAPGAWAADGDTFTYRTREYATVTFMVISEDEKTCQVGAGSTASPAISTSYSGEVTIPKTANGYTVTTIAKGAFASCRTLTKVTIPEGISVIGESAFESCKALTSIELPSTITSIGRFAFLSSGVVTFTAHMRELPEITVNSTFGTNIPSTTVLYVPYDCILKYTSHAYWYGNNGFKTIYPMSDQEGMLVKQAEEGPWLLFKVLSETDKTCQVGDGTSAGTANAIIRLTTTYNYTGELSVPSDVDDYQVTAVGQEAFYRSSVTKFSLPDAITAIGNKAFQNNQSFTTFDLPASLQTIGHLAFGYTKLSSIALPEGLETIDTYAFQDCSGITSIELPSTLSSIGNWAFTGTSLTTIQANRETPPTISANTFDQNHYNQATLSLALSSMHLYGEHPYWSQFLHYDPTIDDPDAFVAQTVEGASIVFKITDEAAKICQVGTGCTAVIPPYNGPITIPEEVNGYRVTNIEREAFYVVPGMTSVVIPEGVTAIGYHAFMACKSLGVVVFPSTLTTINDEAFYNCPSLKFVFLPANITSIGKRVFDGTTALVSLTICWQDPSSVDHNWCVSNYADCMLCVPSGTRALYAATPFWQDFKSINELNMGTAGNTDNLIEFADANVKAICVENWDTNGDGELSKEEAAAVTTLLKDNGDGTYGDPVFKGNTTITSFEELQYFTGLTSIEKNAFYNCSNLKSVIVPKNVTQIGSSGFQGCSHLSVVLPEGLTSIANDGFRNCYYMTDIKLPESLTTIERQVFADCHSLKTLFIPKNVKTIGYNALINLSGAVALVVDPANTVYDSRGGCNAIIKTATNEVIAGCKNTVIPEGIKIVSGLCNQISLTSITIPSTVTTISVGAFYYCRKLTSVVSKIAVPFAFGSNAFANISADCVLTVPAGTRDAYIAAGWTEDVFKGGVVEETKTNDGDVNCDGKVTIADVTKLVNIILGKD